MLHKMGTFTATGRKVSPPTPTYMNDDQKSTYLQSLRTNRPARPTGSRPAPFKTNHLTRSDSAPVLEYRGSKNDRPCLEHSAMAKSTSLTSSVGNGRPLASAPDESTASVRGRTVSPTATIQRLNTMPTEYPESASRKLEKEEAHTLREALHIIDHRDEEKKLYTAAQAEAADLVWQHRNPQAAEDEKTAPYINPEVQKRKAYGSELGTMIKSAPRNASDSSTSSNGTSNSSTHTTNTKDRALSDALKELQLASEGRTAVIVASANDRRRSSGKRVVSSASNRSLFRYPEDQIYEEPQTVDSVKSPPLQHEPPLNIRSCNSLPRASRPPLEKAMTTPVKRLPWINRIEIQRNPPSQSRNAAYLDNNRSSAPKEDAIEEVDTPKSNGGLEVRGDDIRAATSMKKKDRSPKLPTPVAVSDLPGRPIVSFDPSWRPVSDSPRNSQDMVRPVIKFSESPRTSKDLSRPLPRPLPSKTEPINSAPVVPTINLPDDDPVTSVPTIRLPDDDPGLPTINFQDDLAPPVTVSAPATTVHNERTTSKPPARPLPVHAATTPLPTKTSRLPWLNGPRTSGPTVSCTACSLPISGRIVTAAGLNSSTTSTKARFHPNCFRCANCSTSLEAIAFFPEPVTARQERIEASQQPDAEEADVRFYCHLDFHELFSPRCRSCKTPIEGAVISACGQTYHEDHFFCAECGDPFSSATPFVEHNGYAYCVTCHTKRTSARCKGCKQVILDELTVEALGGKWHDQCFVCYECGGGFGDDGRFFVRDINVEPTEKEKRRGVTRKQEERAVCQVCEEVRLKA